jgi:hypothetical protein
LRDGDGGARSEQDDSHQGGKREFPLKVINHAIRFLPNYAAKGNLIRLRKTDDNIRAPLSQKAVMFETARRE